MADVIFPTGIPDGTIDSADLIMFADVSASNATKDATVASLPVSTATQTALDAKVTANAGITGATKTKITYDAKGLVTAGADATTADIAASTDKNYVTDAQAVVIGNTSGTNSGNQTITNSSDSTSHTVTLSATGGSVQLVEGANITLTTTGTGANGVVTIASTGGGGSGDVTAASNITDNAIVRGDGGAKGVQSSGVYVDDNGFLGVNNASPTGSFDVTAVVYNPGTVSVTGTAVIGTSTEFTKTFKVGDSITTTTSSGSETKEINSITSDTVMATVAAFAGTSTNTAYTTSNTGSQFVILPNGQVRVAGTTVATSASVSDWISKADTVTATGTQQFTAFRDQTVYNQTTGTTAAINTFASGSRINATGTGAFANVRGINSFPTVISTNTGNITTIAAMLSAPQIQGGATGTITNWKGFSFNGTNGSSTNTITNMIGIDIIPTMAAGTLTNYAGIIVGAKPTAATNNSTLLLLNTATIPSGTWGIYNSSTANNYINGNIGVGTTSPTAYLHLKAGTATASTAPIKLTAGTVNTTSEAGAIEFDGTDFFFNI